ncbi:DUF192 domain-containing protein [Geomonas sp. Red69]|uniref:DUF192 domain-containing protein n=1 Tax=Geomonas diazotrophica TaxID=2843197 RepID=A0ABX8JPS3_9BACT|nr:MULTISPECIES: DUF192 domain-containing protein [Geomonas]MBU5636420.1 DUF192 domain-containing protein [Geomonas diazotrophica]QWV99086.1 DUF192 domain-containing protein [Geomonas nitrogeniifigens]QXE88254.1 DUF192 domain-containing protein [Geomonas nitrogeniifigens]
MRAIDHTSGRELARTVCVAESFLARLKGLLGREELPPGQGLWIKPCKSVHTFGMKFPIDVAFLDGELRVVALVTLAPNRVSGFHPKASSVLELPAGTLDPSATVVGNRIEIA